MHDILKLIQVHTPFHFLHDRFLPMVIKERINPEISFNHVTLDRFRKEDYIRVADSLLDAGLTITFHAPFMDLRPGALDPKIRQITIDRLNQVFDLVPHFRPLSVVCHPSFDKRYYVSSEQLWLENSVETWKIFLTRAIEMNTIIAFENVYESDCQNLGLLLNEFSSPHVIFCFDTGHFNVFSTTPLEEWMGGLWTRLGPVDRIRSLIEVQIICKGKLVKGESLWLEYRGEALPIDYVFGTPTKREVRGYSVYATGFNLSS
ncbi:MAG: TIM barrel protein [Deltaproteobacteria bacterium]|nr:TIM barrel protein [Deltaproteobacteria bacterium]